MPPVNIDTIVALSSGSLPSGVAVVRVSGPACQDILMTMTGALPNPRIATLKRILGSSSEVIDEGLILWFPGPSSYTGEDCAEFHVHGGKAVVSALIDRLCGFPSVRLADAGEFSKRSFENGKNDLTAIDGIADLIASETEQQRKLAASQSQGALRELYEGWRERLVYIRAMLEAEFDFSDEEDVPAEISEQGLNLVGELVNEIKGHLEDDRAGEIIRDGFRVALMGAPNAGKSSLLNYMASRDIAIVTDQAGTTRDVLEAHLDVDGYKVVVYDTAGLRPTSDRVEREGIKRAQVAGDESEVVLWLSDDADTESVGYMGDTDVIMVHTKQDLDDPGFEGGAQLSVSVKTGFGITALIDMISKLVKERAAAAYSGLITRKRYRSGLIEVLGHLDNVITNSFGEGLELRAEEVRLAGIALGRLTGKVDVEDLLDVIFSEFCVGK